MKQTSIELNQKNYSIIKDVEGSAEGGYFIGIGGLSKKSLNSIAEAEMLKNAKLEGSQAIVNQTSTIKAVGFFPIYWKYKTISQGQVIEFTK